jgi:hypothetical protein
MYYDYVHFLFLPFLLFCSFEPISSSNLNPTLEIEPMMIFYQTKCCTVTLQDLIHAFNFDEGNEIYCFVGRRTKCGHLEVKTFHLASLMLSL